MVYYNAWNILITVEYRDNCNEGKMNKSRLKKSLQKSRLALRHATSYAFHAPF